jgi:hypothetical protein
MHLGRLTTGLFRQPLRQMFEREIADEHDCTSPEQAEHIRLPDRLPWAHGVRGVAARTVPDRWARRQLQLLVRRRHCDAQRYPLLAEWRLGHLTEVKATSVIDRRY